MRPLAEMESTESPIVLAQDYHFALLPRMIKEARPDARVAIFSGTSLGLIPKSSAFALGSVNWSMAYWAPI